MQHDNIDPLTGQALAPEELRDISKIPGYVERRISQAIEGDDALDDVLEIVESWIGERQDALLEIHKLLCPDNYDLDLGSARPHVPSEVKAKVEVALLRDPRAVLDNGRRSS